MRPLIVLASLAVLNACGFHADGHRVVYRGEVAPGLEALAPAAGVSAGKPWYAPHLEPDRCRSPFLVVEGFGGDRVDIYSERRC